MKKHPLFWQWAGYLSNPIRGTDIHAEIHPSKEKEFREKYFELTREPILLPGDSTPFYVWKENVNKYGKQLRVYFNGNAETLPETLELFRITNGRTEGGLRINSNEFVLNLFSIGFLLGRNVNCLRNLQPNVPHIFKDDFIFGLNMVSPIEEMENLIFAHCEQNGNLTEKSKNLKKLWKNKNISPDALLDALCKNKTLIKNKEQDGYTLFNVARLRGEIESKSLQTAIDLELDKNKREILMETYVRDRGWIRLAKTTFGDVCMYDDCQNTFRKDDGEYYIETHHIKSLSDGGKDHICNLSVLCAHHHRMAHFAEQNNRDELRCLLQRKNRNLLKNLGL